MVRLVLEQGFHAANAEEASAAIQSVFGVGTAHVESVGQLRYSQWSLVDDAISTTDIESRGAVVRLNAGASPDMVVIAVRHGYLTLEQDGGTFALQAGDLGLVPLEHAVRASWERVAMDLYSFPRSTLTQLLSGDTSQIALRVARVKAVSPTLIALWKRSAATISEDILQNPELAESDVVRDESIRTLLALTIEAFGITDATEDDAVADQIRLERATAFMRDNLDHAISVTDVARAVGVSIHGLQLVFQRTGNGTPLTRLRGMRMDTARQALTSATSPTSVDEVARRVGYTNRGRFDAHYFDANGSLPEHDLARAADATSP